MKRFELEQKLKAYGWKLIRRNKHHDIWGNEKGEEEPVSRSKGKDVPKFVAEKVLRKARMYPG